MENGRKEFRRVDFQQKPRLWVFLFMWLTVVFLSLVTLKVANDVGGYWINICWAVSFLFGVETIYLLRVIEEWKKWKMFDKNLDER